MKIIECPRDAMQGWQTFIPTQQKIDYINALLQVGFDTIDFGSFVSPKAIPQMADTKDVLKGLELSNSSSKLLAIIANERGAKEAMVYEQIAYLGFPFSVSPTFQLRNTNSNQEDSLHTIDAIQALCERSDKQLVVYLSMGFGNPYNDAYDETILLYWANEMALRNIKIISLADTVGLAKPSQITTALKTLIPSYPLIEFGVHLHSNKLNSTTKLQAAIHAGCQRFDGALKGIGGCPMAQDDLVGNMDSLQIISELNNLQKGSSLNNFALKKAVEMAEKVFV